MSKLDLLDLFKRRTRHPFRPRASDIIGKLFPDFKADNHGGVSLVTGTCRFLNKRLFVIGQQKPKPSDLKSKKDLERLNYGMPTSDDHSKILSVLKKAKASDPDKTFIYCLIDTYGADISMYSAQRFRPFSYLI